MDWIAQWMSLGRYQEVRLAGAREQVIKHRRVVFEGNDPRHLLNNSSEHALLGHIALEFLTLHWQLLEKELY